MNRTQERLELWCSAPNVRFQSPEAEEAYKKRAKRIADAVLLETPDRVPIAPLVTFFAANYVGITAEDAMYDHDKAYAAFRKVALDFQWDTAFSHVLALPGPLYEALDFKQLKWPGHGVPRNCTYQYVEEEYMKAEEYDAFLDDPSDFLIRTVLPRVAGAFAPFQMLPPLSMIVPCYTGVLMMLGSAAIGGAANAFTAINKASESFMKFILSAVAFREELQSLGFPFWFGPSTQAPFDIIGDSLRGTKGVMLDMYRQPDKLLKATDRLLPTAIQTAMAGAATSPSPFVFIPLHKGAMGFMSLSQFKTFYWPTLHKLMLELIEQGLIPLPFFEAEYTDRLEIIKDIPKGKALYWFEKTDIFKAKEILGDHVCIKGNIPSSLLCTGTAEQVKDYCKKLIDIVGKGGGLIVDGAVGIPDEAKPENVKVMTTFVKEYGVYK